MKIRYVIDLILLAAIWGASFLFMRVSVPEFGAIPMIFVRVALAAIVLLPIVIWRKQMDVFKRNWFSISIVGIINSAIPFSLIAYSTLYVSAGFASVLNATTPIFASIVAFVWLKQKLSVPVAVGLVVGIAGVILLVWGKISLGVSGQSQTVVAIFAGLSSTVAYGIGANYTKKYLAGVDPVVITVGSQLIAGIVLFPLAITWWPESNPSVNSWLNVVILAVVCTALAQIIYFRLIENIGATNTTTVTFLIPVFGLFWGYLILQEVIQLTTIIAGVVILVGTGLSTGIISFKKTEPY